MHIAVKSWTREIVKPAYDEARKNLDPEGLAKFEADMIQYLEESDEIDDMIKIDKGQRSELMRRKGASIDREVRTISISIYHRYIFYMCYRFVSCTNVGLLCSAGS